MINKRELQEDDLKGKTLVKFYELIAAKLGYDISDENIRYDCTKILIANNIQDGIYEAYRKEFPKEFEQSPRDAECQVTMILAASGPKVKKELPDYMVETLEGFVTFKTNN